MVNWQVFQAMGENFAQMLQSEDAPDPQWVVDAYLKLAEIPFGKSSNTNRCWYYLGC
jgi:hypothetical protein